MIEIYKVSRKMKRIAKNALERKRFLAANNIQRIWRGHVARKRVEALWKSTEVARKLERIR